MDSLTFSTSSPNITLSEDHQYNETLARDYSLLRKTGLFLSLNVRMAHSEEHELQTLRTPSANNQIQEPQEFRKLPKHKPERSCPFNVGIGLFVVQGGAIDEQDGAYLPQPVTSPTTIRYSSLRDKINDSYTVSKIIVAFTLAAVGVAGIYYSSKSRGNGHILEKLLGKAGWLGKLSG